MKKILAVLLVTVLTFCMLPLYASASTVYAVDVADIDLPMAGNKPDLTARLTSLSDVMKITLVEWSEYDPDWEWQRDLTANDTFKEGYWYVLYVYLQTETGHSFGQSVVGTINGTNAKKVGNATQANGTKVGFYVSYQATKKLTSIGKVELSVVRPFVGKTPTFAKVDTAQYLSEKYGTVSNCSNGVTWTNQSSGVNLSVSNPFKEGVKYKVSYYLTAKDGFKFDRNTTTATINGAAATVTFTDHFHAIVSLGDLTPGDDTAISKVDLTVVKPIIGKTPTFAKVDTAQYVSEKYGTVSNCSNGVTWTNQSSNVNLTVSNPFKEGVKYKVSYYLTAKQGYKFDKNTKATVNGATATVTVTDATHAIVSLGDLVPGDGKKEIASLDLNVTAPKEGEKPDFTKLDGIGYYSDNGANGSSTRIYKNGIAWYKSASSFISPGTTETFAGGTAYTVKLSLLPKEGYKFSKSLTAKVNGKTATVESFDDGSVTVSVKLTALSKAHTHTASGWKNDGEQHWKVCTDAACGQLTTAKEAHKDTNKDFKCDVCGYAIPKPTTTTTAAPTTQGNGTTTAVPQPTGGEPEPTDPTEPSQPVDGEPEPTEPVTPDVSEPEGDGDGGNGSLVWIIVAVVAVLIAGGVVTFVLVSKKKQ